MHPLGFSKVGAYGTDDRPTDLAFWKNSNGHILATGYGSSDPLHVWFYRVGFSGRRIKCLYFRSDQIQEHGRQPSCIIFSGRISETVHSVQFVFGSRVKVWEKIMREE